MHDICERLRSTPRADIREVMCEAADEIKRLRDAIDEQTGRAAWNYDCLTQCEERVIQRDAEIERLRLTPEERKAIEIAAGVIEDEYLGTSCTDKLGAAVLLYGLLDRIGPTGSE